MIQVAYSNWKIFLVELIGTYVLVVFATGSIVYDWREFNGMLGVSFAAVAPFIALIFGVYLFGKISLAHFNPAVTVAYFITGHTSRRQLPYYFTAELIGAILGSLSVLYFIGNYANLGANAPNLDYSMFVIFPVEVLASALLMGVILYVVYTNGLRGFSGIAIGGIVALDILFLSYISGASMNPARALGPALISGTFESLWLYWTAPFVGTVLVALLSRSKFK